MIVPKGFRAREKAALQRRKQGLVSEDVRNQRHSVLADKITAQIAAEQDQPTNSPQLAPPVKADAPAQTDTSTDVKAGDETKAAGEKSATANATKEPPAKAAGPQESAKSNKNKAGK
jgi:hypothetical protein